MIAINVEERGHIVNSTPTNTALNDSDSRAPPELCGELESSKALEPGVNERKQLAPPIALPAKPVSPASSTRPLPSRSSLDKSSRLESSRASDMASAAAVSGGPSSARLIRHQNELQHEASQGVSAPLKDGDGHEFESFYKEGEPDDHTLSKMHIGGVCAPILSDLSSRAALESLTFRAACNSKCFPQSLPSLCHVLQAGWSAEQMFDMNEAKHKVKSTYDEEMADYTYVLRTLTH